MFFCPPPPAPIPKPPPALKPQVTPKQAAPHKGGGKFARSKGQRGEREIVALLQVIVDKVNNEYGTPTLLIQRNTIQAHIGGHDLHGLDSFAIEIKRCEDDAQIGSWWAQCLRQAKPHQTPILLYRASHQPWKCRMMLCGLTPMKLDFTRFEVNCSWECFAKWFEKAYSEYQLRPQ